MEQDWQGAPEYTCARPPLLVGSRHRRVEGRGRVDPRRPSLGRPTSRTGDGVSVPMSGVVRPAAVQARLARAQRHVDDLEAMLGEYVARPPYRVERRDGERGRVIQRAALRDEPPIEAAMIVSDAVHQARAALDNLVNGLRPTGPASGIEFPIRSTVEAYRASVSGGAL